MLFMKFSLVSIMSVVMAQDQITFQIPATPSKTTFYVAPQSPYAGLSKKFAVYMQYSAAAYCPSTVTSARTWSCGTRCQGETTGTIPEVALRDSRTQTAGFVAYHPGRKEIIVTFRGTQSIQSAVTDIQLLQSEPDFEPSIFKKLSAKSQFPAGVKIHVGFENGYSFIRNQVQAAIASLATRFLDYSIVFTGHSLGGALAEIAAADFHILTNGKFSERVSVTTFGQPRVGNPEWARYVQSLPFASRFTRIVADRDPVAQLPPRFLNYQFAGSQYEINRSNETVACATSGPNGETEQCADPVFKLNILQHITGYYGWWTYPWFC
jgi:hypothetical protein